MRISEIRLENWKNFRLADVSLHRRMFVIRPNASGKSNFLDAIRFLREISDPEGACNEQLKVVVGCPRFVVFTLANIPRLLLK